MKTLLQSINESSHDERNIRDLKVGDAVKIIDNPDKNDDIADYNTVKKFILQNKVQKIVGLTGGDNEPSIIAKLSNGESCDVNWLQKA